MPATSSVPTDLEQQPEPHRSVFSRVTALATSSATADAIPRLRIQLAQVFARRQYGALIGGESGTGKSWSRKGIHNASRRARTAVCRDRIAPRFRKRCWKTDCSVMKARSPAAERRQTRPDRSGATPAPCFSTKSARMPVSLPNPPAGCCSSASAAARQHRAHPSRRARDRRHHRDLRARPNPAAFAPIFTTASTSLTCSCRPLASAAKMSNC